MTTILSADQYGKAEVRLVVVDRGGAQQTISDLTVSITLFGDFEAIYVDGENGNLVLTDTQKNTVFAFAKEVPIGSIEAFGLRLARHFLAEYAPVTRARVQIDAQPWNRIDVSGRPHPHALARAGAEQRTALAICGTDGEWVVSGLSDLVVLKTAGSEFHGYIEDRYTTLSKTHQRILSAVINARWRHSDATAATEFEASFAGARTALLTSFAVTQSKSLQQTLFTMGSGVTDARPEICEVRLTLPNRHHYGVDLAPFGLSNEDEIFRFEDRPYGLIQGAALRSDAPDPGPVWDAFPLVS